MKNIGLLGGSFDPPHKGHLYISLEAKKLLKLNEIWWMVTPQNPLKISKPATYDERIKNCHEITKGHPIKITEIEKKIGCTYSYQSINYLQNHYKNIKFFWLMGADNLINFHNWQKWKTIIEEISIVVFKRHGYNNKALNSKTAKTFSNFKKISSNFDKNLYSKLPSWTWIDNREVNISSTEIRKQRNLLRAPH